MTYPIPSRNNPLIQCPDSSFDRIEGVDPVNPVLTVDGYGRTHDLTV